MRAFLVTSESRLFAPFAVQCESSPSPSPSLPPSLSSCQSMLIRSDPDSSISLSPSHGWRPPGIGETIRIGAGQIISSCSVPAVWLVVGRGRDGELLLLAAALNVVNGGSHAKDKLATEALLFKTKTPRSFDVFQNDDGPQKIFDALKDPCCMFFGSEHRVVSIVVASFYLNIPKDALKVMCKSFGIDHPAVLIKDPYPKIAGDALKVTCKSLVSDYPVVLIVDPFNPKTLEMLSKS
ncbi:uncharacterized protein LOC104438515 isoform X1 [Eucalyptus grandis]|uniref:uncharacterized protein LOC104438515 isoform X1 n=1 Tax=Eucalyptus grandis TaxID=71139 RepID=UPI00192F0241|nr:uncharacterized protein LOC104438515 isoform X1 [Eucalyptus grandis]XP_039168021.1 uncharacterized protein LOC104438515 isoform X1 [Eucalyptus grandis]XP_039168026.1 uncharacterized protein LOC104438515 isoform X1 [Eucalyptus grandis]